MLAPFQRMSSEPFETVPGAVAWKLGHLTPAVGILGQSSATEPVRLDPRAAIEARERPMAVAGAVVGAIAPDSARAAISQT
jgi:hypothetical protein